MVLERPPLKLLSSIAHAVGKPSFESLETEQRLAAIQIALASEMLSTLREISADLDTIRERGK